MNVKLLDMQLLRSLRDETIPFHEVMNAFNIRTTIANLPSSVHAYVYVSRKGRYHLVMNGNINAETQYEVFCHEIKHIIYDLPTVGYIVGLDMQRTEIEKMADLFELA
ncbi:hypothetical protein GJ688_01840 [Heliobacillus mobilis]|uniref:IrrE N-terminal-like domain-containing protein n=1 Tax=Heliobacterium mobile TaxID=28064 RepID=A0A6I3SC42_HELMO|nr:hypothetical protein [Heliobacterium mobile]MTV47723.1 hypothetical protein [Heliobacterium mobile]